MPEVAGPLDDEQMYGKGGGSGMKLNERLEQKSRENMVYFYRRELNQIRGGQSALEVLSDQVRKRLVYYGILAKRYDAGTYFLTPLGEELLTELRARS